MIDLGKGPTAVLFADATPVGMHVFIAGVTVPDRASIAIDLSITEHPTVAALSASAAALPAKLRLGIARASRCGSELAGTLPAAVADFLSALPESDRLSMTTAQWRSLQDFVDGVYRTAVTTPPSLGAPNPCFIDIKQVTELQQADGTITQQVKIGVDAVLSATRVTKAQLTYSNEAPTRFRLGLQTGTFVGHVSGDTRVKIDNGGKYAADPIGNSVTLVTLNWHPWAFTQQTPAVSSGERWSLFGGVVVSPTIGLALGVSYTVVRGVSLNAGYSVLFINSLPADRTIGQLPVNAKNPFVTGAERAILVTFGLKLE